MTISAGRLPGALHQAHDSEPLGFRGLRQLAVRSDEAAAARPVSTPRERRGKLQGVGRSQRVDGEPALRLVTQDVGGLHLVPVPAEMIEPR